MLPRKRPTFALLSRLKRSASVTLQKRGGPQGQVSPGTEKGWGGLDLLECGDMRKPLGAWGKEKCVLGNWGNPQGGCEAWRRASCIRLASAQFAVTLLGQPWAGRFRNPLRLDSVFFFHPFKSAK